MFGFCVFRKYALPFWIRNDCWYPPCLSLFGCSRSTNANSCESFEWKNKCWYGRRRCLHSRLIGLVDVDMRNVSVRPRLLRADSRVSSSIQHQIQLNQLVSIDFELNRMTVVALFDFFWTNRIALCTHPPFAVTLFAVRRTPSCDTILHVQRTPAQDRNVHWARWAYANHFSVAQWMSHGSPPLNRKDTR